MAQVREEDAAAAEAEPQELWGGYVPYRVARAELPERAETEDGAAGDATGAVAAAAAHEGGEKH